VRNRANVIRIDGLVIIQILIFQFKIVAFKAKLERREHPRDKIFSNQKIYRALRAVHQNRALHKDLFQNKCFQSKRSVTNTTLLIKGTIIVLKLSSALCEIGSFSFGNVLHQSWRGSKISGRSPWRRLQGRVIGRNLVRRKSLRPGSPCHLLR